MDAKLRGDGHYRLAWTFTLRQSDLLPVEDDEWGDSDTRSFSIGSVEGQYRRVRADVLGTTHDVLIDRRLGLIRKYFIAPQNISVFGRIDDLVDEQIVIGGDREGAIPTQDFLRLVREFPTSTEMRLYSWARVSRILREHMETMTDAERRLSDHMDRRSRALDATPSVAAERLPAANTLELEKFTFVRDLIAEMLATSESYSEADWQRTIADLFLLIFPQYIAVLQKVQVKDTYSRRPHVVNRELDLVLVSAGGAIDVLEIKKPFSNGLMSVRQYRDNHVPVRELSGTVMQVEKYLFYLSKSGPQGERSIAEKHGAELPPGLDIHITNPKAFVLSGRDSNFTGQQAFDFEFVRRKYSNVVDILTYDDLLRRLNNILVALSNRERSTTESESPTMQTDS